MNIGSLINQGLTNQANHEVSEQQVQRQQIPDQLKQVAKYVFDTLTNSRPAWQNGFRVNGKLNPQMIAEYKVLLLKTMEREKINSFQKVEKGLNKLVSQSGAFLPSIGDFIQACKDESHGELNAAMYQEFRDRKSVV